MDAPANSSWRLCRGVDDSWSSTLAAVLRTAGATRVNLTELRRGQSLQGGDISPEAKELTGAARAEYRERGFGFWDFLLVPAARATERTRAALFQRAIRHDHGGARRTTLSIDEFEREHSRGSFAELDDRTIVSLTSTIALADGSAAHLPMLDLALAANEANDSAAVAMLAELGLKGHLYASGSSYHFISSTPSDWPNTVKLLARAQLLGPLVDHRWISHQLIDGECSLRVSTDQERHKAEHILVASSD